MKGPISRLAESQAGRSNGFHASTQGNPYPSGIVLFIGLNASSRASPLVALCLLRTVLWPQQGSNDIRFFVVVARMVAGQTDALLAREVGVSVQHPLSPDEKSQGTITRTHTSLYLA